MLDITMYLYTPQFEEHRWYICVFKLNDTQAYFAAYCAGGRWQTACGTDLTDDGWELVSISDELPPLPILPPVSAKPPIGLKVIS